MKVILNVPDEGYSERTWWRLFWAYLMKVIPETRSADYIWYLRVFFTLAYKILQENFEEIKEIIISHKSKKERQYNDKKTNQW